MSRALRGRIEVTVSAGKPSRMGARNRTGLARETMFVGNVETSISRFADTLRAGLLQSYTFFHIRLCIPVLCS